MAAAAQAGTSRTYDYSQPGAWARAILDGIGAPSDPGSAAGRQNIAFLESWRRAEGTKAAYNPLATTLPAGGSTAFNDAHVQNYATPDEGVTATAKTLLAGYPHVLAMLRAGDPGQVSSSAGVWADLNRWVSGKSTPTDSSYVQTIARGYFGEKGAADWTSFDLTDAGAAAAGAAAGAAKKVADATGVTALASIAQSVSAGVGALLNMNTWRRIGLALLGLVMMLSGGYILAKGAGVVPAVVPLPV